MSSWPSLLLVLLPLHCHVIPFASCWSLKGEQPLFLKCKQQNTSLTSALIEMLTAALMSVWLLALVTYGNVFIPDKWYIQVSELCHLHKTTMNMHAYHNSSHAFLLLVPLHFQFMNAVFLWYVLSNIKLVIWSKTLINVFKIILSGWKYDELCPYVKSILN